MTTTPCHVNYNFQSGGRHIAFPVPFESAVDDIGPFEHDDPIMQVQMLEFRIYLSVDFGIRIGVESIDLVYSNCRHIAVGMSPSSQRF